MQFVVGTSMYMNCVTFAAIDTNSLSQFHRSFYFIHADTHIRTRTHLSSITFMSIYNLFTSIHISPEFINFNNHTHISSNHSSPSNHLEITIKSFHSHPSKYSHHSVITSSSSSCVDTHRHGGLCSIIQLESIRASLHSHHVHHSHTPTTADYCSEE